VLEFNRQLPAQGSAAPAEAAVLDGNPLLPAGDLPEQALAGFVLPQEELLGPEVAQAEVVESLQTPPQEVPRELAEQWLLGMLGQQTLQLEAREQPVLAQALPAAVTSRLADARAQDREPLPLLPQQSADIAQEQAQEQAKEQASVLATAQWSPSQAAGQALPESKQSQPALAATPSALTPLASALATETPGNAVPEPLTSVAVNAPTALAVTPLAQRPLPQAAEARLGEQMLHALRESVEMQVRQGMQQASIRLDPPELGSMEIFVSHDSGRLNVQISAGNIEVARLLQQTSERLRQELVGGNFLQVNVQVGSEGHSGRQQGRPMAPWQEPEVRAAQRLGESATDAQTASDVLVTV
jgi:flagellar hook-length control protein FliK